LNLWRGNAPPWSLLGPAALAGIIMALPIGYVLIRAAEAGGERWMRLFQARIPQLLWNTLALMLVVSAAAVIIGVALALLVERARIPGLGIWRWLLAVPLIFPPYVGALTYIIVFGPVGQVSRWLGAAPVRLYSFGGTAFVLTMFTYPYVYLIVSAALRRTSANLEEAALSCGLSPRQVVTRVIIPMLQPAIGAGAILVALYVISDFGAIAMLRYDTFTRAIYFQMTGRFDRSGAAILSTVLVGITLLVLWLEARARGKRRFQQSVRSLRPAQRLSLGRWRVPALVFMGLVLLFAVLLPLYVLIHWTWVGISTGQVDPRFARHLGNSLQVSAIAATLCTVLTIPVVYLRSRYPSVVSRTIGRLAFAGYALPGVIVALGIVFVSNRYMPWLYVTPGMIILAHLMRFMPQSIQAMDASLAAVSPRLDEAARSMGLSTYGVLARVVLPLVLPGILAGSALVFVGAIKELPATLLLRPPGFDTLAVRVWLEAHEGFYAAAAPPALLIVASSALVLRWMLKSGTEE
jgi:iron(III) transport system permease protein